MGWAKIGLDGHRQAYEPGEEVSGAVSWAVEEEPEGVELHLLWYTMGKGDQDVELVRTVPLARGRSGDQTFVLTLPNGPYSFSGKLISLLWALEVVIEPGLATERVELVVAPGGEEVRLHAGA